MSRHDTGDEQLDRGLDMMDKVYGAGIADLVLPAKDRPYIDETIRHQFGEIWSRPDLSIRDRRLLVIGATAMLGRADLIETQVYGALCNGELDERQLDEAVLHLAFYCGWGNASAVSTGVEQAKSRFRTTS
ncbi:MAG TPA: carboxymuconolactone decarboxylase family protein [Pseudomonas sp.]|nr:carboxymuconolactone decarboxylase family protein [Pseudomonas sp.]